MEESFQGCFWPGKAASPRTVLLPSWGGCYRGCHPATVSPAPVNDPGGGDGMGLPRSPPTLRQSPVRRSHRRGAPRRWRGGKGTRHERSRFPPQGTGSPGAPSRPPPAMAGRLLPPDAGRALGTEDVPPFHPPLWVPLQRTVRRVSVAGGCCMPRGGVEGAILPPCLCHPPGASPLLVPQVPVIRHRGSNTLNFDFHDAESPGAAERGPAAPRSSGTRPEHPLRGASPGGASPWASPSDAGRRAEAHRRPPRPQ